MDIANLSELSADSSLVELVCAVLAIAMRVAALPCAEAGAVPLGAIRSGAVAGTAGLRVGAAAGLAELVSAAQGVVEAVGFFVVGAALARAALRVTAHS